MTVHHWAHWTLVGKAEMVEAAEVTSIYNHLNCRLKANLALNPPAKELMKALASVGRY